MGLLTPVGIVMNHLSDNFYTIPHLARTTMTTRELRETLSHTDGAILANGSMWDIVSKHLGAGVYRVTLKKMFAD